MKAGTIEPSGCNIWSFKSDIKPASTLPPKPPEIFGHIKPKVAKT